MTIEKKQNTLVVILGPTGIGKTNLSIEIAKELDTEILSCDSRQMYRELNIGTAVPEPLQLASVQHHFIGNLSIHDYYNAGTYELQAIEKLRHIFNYKKYAVMTGGSGLYIDAVVKGIDDLPNIDPNIRANLLERLKIEGLLVLQEELKKIDPEYFEQADIQNSKRILKALEVFYMTGKTYSSLRTNPTKVRPFHIIQVGLQMSRDILYERINLRVDKMLAAGLVDEARQFYNYRHLNALNTVGYKELFGHFEGNYNLEEAIRLIKRNSRHYAKRQITYWNRDNSIHWFHPEQKTEILDFISSCL
jgi:tRNA dimethylallyltransferase